LVKNKGFGKCVQIVNKRVVKGGEIVIYLEGKYSNKDDKAY
jgi:hypothetical protein